MSNPRDPYRKPPRVWTPERADKVRQLAEQGMSDPEIGAALGVSRSIVEMVRRRYKIASPIRPLPCEQAPVDFFTVAPTMNTAECARHFGRSIKVVRRWYREHEITPAPRVYISKAKPEPVKPPKASRGQWGVTMLPEREDGAAASAARELQRLGPVFRMRVVQPKAPADMWVVFGRPMHEQDMIARAQRCAA